MKHNYRNYSNAGNRAVNAVDEAVPAEVTEDVKEVIAEAAANEEIDVDDSVSIEAPAEEIPEDDSQIGKVVNCKRLNIRKRPNKDSDPVCVVTEGTVLMIDLKRATTPDWYAVYTEAGVEGYCMKEFVEISK